MPCESLQDNGIATPPPLPVFQVREVTKVYAMGEVEVYALRSVSSRSVRGPTARNLRCNPVDCWHEVSIAVFLFRTGTFARK